jgi:hypothetical protein
VYCQGQRLQHVTFGWNDVTPALWHPHVIQMSARVQSSVENQVQMV